MIDVRQKASFTVKAGGDGTNDDALLRAEALSFSNPLRSIA